MNIQKETIQVSDGKETREFEAQLSFDRKKYTLYVTPVSERRGGFVVLAVMHTASEVVHEAGRRSTKQDAIAKDLATKEKMEALALSPRCWPHAQKV